MIEQTARTTALIQSNLDEVRERMRKAAERVGRRVDDIKLVVVTKNVGPEILGILRDLGVSDIGENKVQEALRKGWAGEFTWHMVGHLQRNKARHAVRLFSLIHSLDSLKLAQELQRQASRNEITISTLIQVNMSGEPQKYGLSPEDVIPFLKDMANLSNVRVKGLMTMAPFTSVPETCRVFFRGLRELRDQVASLGLDGINMDELSMGMTQDFEVAIEEGATIVRIGSAVFKGIEKV